MPVLPPDASVEQLQEAVKSKKPTCAGIQAFYSCGSHDVVPQYSGPIISVSAGDELAMNSLLLTIVEIDGGGNGIGKIKMPMMDRVKLGVTLSGIQVAEGGCIVAGRAELSGVEAAILNAQQREELAKIYAEFNKAIDTAIENAEVIAKTYNTFSEKLGGIKEQAAILFSNKNSSTQKEVAALTSATTDQMQASLDAMRAAYGDKINQEMAANIEKMIADNRAQVAVLSNPAATPEAVEAASQALAATNPTEVEKTIKNMQPLAIEYNGKLFYNGTKITISNKDVVAGFTIKNNSEGESLSWLVLDKSSELHNYTTNPIGLAWPKEKESLTLLAKSGSRTIEVELIRKTFSYTDLIAKDKSRTKRLALGSKNETLYLVRTASTNLSSRTVSYEMVTEAKKSDFMGSEPKWSTTFPKGGLYEGDVLNGINSPTGETRHNSAGSGTTTASAFGEEHSVKIKVVDQNRHDADFMPPGVNALLTKTYTAVEGGMKQVEKVVSFFDDGIKVKVLPLKINGSMYNKEHDSRHYLEVLDGSISGGFGLISGEKVVYPPFLKILNIKNVSKCGLYGAFSVDLPIAGGVSQETIFETKKKTKDNPFYAKFGAKGCIEAGLKFELLVAKDAVNTNVRGYGKGCLSGNIVYDGNDKDFRGEVVLDPVVVGISAKVSSKGFIEFELVDWSDSYSLTKEIKIWESKKK
jgi:hypothetical protein